MFCDKIEGNYLIFTFTDADDLGFKKVYNIEQEVGEKIKWLMMDLPGKDGNRDVFTWGSGKEVDRNVFPCKIYIEEMIEDEPDVYYATDKLAKTILNFIISLSEIYKEEGLIVEDFAAEQEEDVDENEIDFQQFVIRTETAAVECYKLHHQIDNVKAFIYILKKNGKTEAEEIEAYYCRTCCLYYILEEDYQDLKKKGTILCPIMTYKQYQRYKNSVDDELNEESPLKMVGYNVASGSHELKTKERQTILAYMIESGYMESNRIIQYLEWFIRRNGNHNNMGRAVSKWQDDVKFVRSYKHTGNLVGVKYLKDMR